MKEMDEGQERVARENSAEFERFWRVMYQSSRGTASLEDVLWATQFMFENAPNYQGLMQLTTDEAEREILDLVFLGLYHRGYRFPPEFKYLKVSEN